MTTGRRTTLPASLAGGSRRALTALGALGLVATLGCSAGGKSDQAVAPPDYYSTSGAVCTLLRPADLRTVLGYSYADGAEGETAALTVTGITKCVYKASNRAAGLVVTGVVYSFAEQVYAELEKQRQKAFPGKIQGVSGLGDKAMWSPQAQDLVALTGKKVVGVSIFRSLLETDSQAKERARRLLSKALRRLR